MKWYETVAHGGYGSGFGVITHRYVVRIKVKTCCDENNKPRFSQLDISGNTPRGAERFGFSVLVVGVTTTRELKYEQHKSEPYEDSGPYETERYKYKLKVVERTSVGLNPGVLFFSVDIGLSKDITEKLLATDETAFEVKCCKGSSQE
jgi:hypothetical protein